MNKPTRKQARAVTAVFWDINLCPVPSGFDPSRVRPCLKRYLKKRGYSRRRVTITAVGVLANVPARILRSVFSSGISLINVPYGSGSSDTRGVVSAFAENNPPSEANIMVISDPNIFTGVSGYYKHHLLQPCPYDSLRSLLEQDSGAPDEETVEYALWDCLVCQRDPPSHVFEDLITHLHGEEHEELLQKRITLDNGGAPPRARSRREPFMTWDWCPLYPGPRVTKQEAVTFVFWDINTYTVPRCSDVPLVAPCIKRFLVDLGYIGPCVFIAVGLLTDVPVDILRAVSSCGITLTNLPYGCSEDIKRLLIDFIQIHDEDEVPANFMVLSVTKILENDYGGYLNSMGYNLLPPFPYASLQSFLPVYSGGLDEEYYKCSSSESSSYWFCSVCHPGLAYKGFDSFTTHISSDEHLSKLVDPLHIKDERSKEAVTFVFWDMKQCPVPPCFDPCLVGPSIKGFLEKSGYTGPVKITALGALTDVPHDILRGLYYGGISFEHNSGKSTILFRLIDYALDYPSPANFMVICDLEITERAFQFLSWKKKFNILQHDSLESFLPEVLLDDEEGDKYSKCISEMVESASFVCDDCCPGDVEKDFEKFSTHLSSRRHQRRMLDFLPYNARFLRKEGDASSSCHGDKSSKGKAQETTEGVNKNKRKRNNNNDKKKNKREKKNYDGNIILSLNRN